MALKLVMVAVKMIDICAISQHDTPHLLIVERTDQVKESLVKTIWHDYIYSTENDKWKNTRSRSFYLPQCDRIFSVVRDNMIVSIAKSNIENALYLLKSENGEKCLITAVNLSTDSWTQIEIPPTAAWSTPFLPMEQCLFNPHIHLCNKETIITANAADASARIFLVNDPAFKEVCKIDRCFEPCLVHVAGKKIVFGRKCPEDWAVFFNQPETRMAPELLPLKVYILRNDYTVGDTIQLSKGWITGGTFAFDVCSTNDNKVVLATVSGLLKKPVLQILLSPDAGIKWKEYPEITLEEVPYRLKVIATSSRILVACTFKRYDGYHIMATEFDR